jgi:thymidylate synthase
MIESMNAWHGDFKSAFYLHTALDKDNLRKMGSPCLQYVQFCLEENNGLEIVALYRAHDYFHKFLGNAIGLQRLGEFVAARTGRALRGVSIISLHPFTQSMKTKLKSYVAAI